jgi:hypothetical protein
LGGENFCLLLESHFSFPLWPRKVTFMWQGWFQISLGHTGTLVYLWVMSLGVGMCPTSLQ